MINNIQDLVNEVLWKPSFEWGIKKENMKKDGFVNTIKKYTEI